MVYKSKKKTKDGRQYFFRVRYKNIYDEWVDYTSKKFATKKEATDEEALYKAKVMQQDMSVSSITFKKAYNEFMALHSKNIKKQTKKKTDELFNNLTPIHDMPINKLTLGKYNELLVYIENKGFKYDRNNKILGLLKRIIVYSNKYYNTSDKILKFIENFKSVNEEKKEMNFFTLEEYKKFDSAIEDHTYHTFFEMLFYMGFRVGELSALQIKDINFDKNELTIKKTLTTKIKGEIYTISAPKTKNSIRTLPIPKNVLEDIKIVLDKLKTSPKYNEGWFLFGGNLPFKESTITKKKNTYCKLAGVKQIRIHDFRHSCASLLINNGANITLVSKYLGHSKISMTLDIYSHFYKNELNEITKLIANL